MYLSPPYDGTGSSPSDFLDLKKKTANRKTSHLTCSHIASCSVVDMHVHIRRCHICAVPTQPEATKHCPVKDLVDPRWLFGQKHNPKKQCMKSDRFCCSFILEWSSACLYVHICAAVWAKHVTLEQFLLFFLRVARGWRWRQKSTFLQLWSLLLMK